MQVSSKENGWYQVSSTKRQVSSNKRHLGANRKVYCFNQFSRSLLGQPFTHIFRTGASILT